MKQIFLALMILIHSQAAKADPSYLVVCEGEDFTLRLRSDMELIGQQNGWLDYTGTIDYVAKKNGTRYSGPVDAEIMWAKGSAFVVRVLEAEEAAWRKQGLEGGAIGFAGFQSKEEITAKFKAKWSVNQRPSDELTALDQPDQELSCEAF